MVLFLYQEQKHQHSQPLPPSAVAGGGLLASYAIAQCSKETEYHRLFAVTALAFDVVCAASPAKHIIRHSITTLLSLSLARSLALSHTFDARAAVAMCVYTHITIYKKLLLHGDYKYIFTIEPAYD